MEIDVYAQYFEADCVYNMVARKGVLVKLTSQSGGGQISYTVNLSFFPHTAEDDFRVSFDAYAAKEVYNSRGRRSKKREASLLEEIRTHADELATGMNGTIYWEKPLREAVYG